MKMNVRVDGVRAVSEAFTFLSKEATKAGKRAVSNHLELVATDSQMLVPRITGKLARSLRKTIRERPAVFGTLEYTAPYAVVVHEVPRPPSSTGFHKYLEKPWKAHERDLVPMVEEEVAKLIDEAAARGKKVRA